MRDVAAHHACIKTGIGDVWIARQEAHRGGACAHMIRSATHMMIRTCVVEESSNDDIARIPSGRTARQSVLERGPSGKSVLQRECSLNIAKRGHTGRTGRIGKCSVEPSACIGDVVAKRGEPALRLPLEVLEGGPGRNLPRHWTPSSHIA